MKGFLAVLATIAISASAMAQTLEDVIYLKDGGELRGTLIEQVPNAKIRTGSGNIISVSASEIDHIAQETQADGVKKAEADFYKIEDATAYKAESAQNKSQAGWLLSSGMRMLASATYQQRTSKFCCSAICVDVSLGMQISPSIYIGGGICDEILFDYWYFGFLENYPTLVAQMPVFAHLRYDMKPHNKSPMAELRLGYSFTADEFVDYSGIYINPNIGYRQGKITIALGIELLKLNNEWMFSLTKLNGTVEEKNIKIQKSIQARVTMEWGGRKARRQSLR